MNVALGLDTFSLCSFCHWLLRLGSLLGCLVFLGGAWSLDGNPRGVCGRWVPEMLEAHQAPVKSATLEHVSYFNI